MTIYHDDDATLSNKFLVNGKENSGIIRQIYSVHLTSQNLVEDFQFKHFQMKYFEMFVECRNFFLPATEWREKFFFLN